MTYFLKEYNRNFLSKDKGEIEGENCDKRETFNKVEKYVQN